MRSVMTLMAVALTLAAACTPPVAGGGIACTEIGCTNGVTVAVAGIGLGAGGGRLHAEMCVDDRCEKSRYTQQPDGASRYDNPRLEIFAEPDAVQVTFALPDGDYDTTTSHAVSLRLRVAGGGQVVVEQEVHLQRSQPNGPDCPPVCWQARIEHAA